MGAKDISNMAVTWLGLTAAIIGGYATYRQYKDSVGNLCDAGIIKDVFGPYATWHWPCLTADINSVRRGEAQLGLARPYGHGMESLAIKDVGSGHCGNLAPAATGTNR